MSDAKQNKAAYDALYMKEHIKQKTIGFNVENADDMKLYDWINRQKNQTQYIKGLIREDMNKSGQ